MWDANHIPPWKLFPPMPIQSKHHNIFKTAFLHNEMLRYVIITHFAKLKLTNTATQKTIINELLQGPSNINFKISNHSIVLCKCAANISCYSSSWHTYIVTFLVPFIAKM